MKTLKNLVIRLTSLTDVYLDLTIWSNLTITIIDNLTEFGWNLFREVQEVFITDIKLSIFKTVNDKVFDFFESFDVDVIWILKEKSQ